MSKLTQNKIDTCKMLIQRHNKLDNEMKDIKFKINQILGDYKKEIIVNYHEWIDAADIDPREDIKTLIDNSFVVFLTQHFDELAELETIKDTFTEILGTAYISDWVAKYDGDREYVEDQIMHIFINDNLHSQEEFKEKIEETLTKSDK